MAQRFLIFFTAFVVLQCIPPACPADILYSTFIGGNEWDSASSLVIDGSGNVYVAGSTTSPDFPSTPGVFDISFNGETDAFIIHLTPEMDQVLAGTFIGGSSHDDGRLLLLDDAGQLVMVGRTISNDFPVTPGAWDQNYNGGSDICVVRMSAELDDLLLSTYYGGSNNDGASGLALHPSGDIVITGSTRSTDYPVTPGCFDPYHSGASDMFVSRLSPFDGSPVASTYIRAPGTYSNEYGTQVVINSHGDVMACGLAGPNFYTTDDAYDPTGNGGFDFVVFRMKPNLAAMGVSTFVGGSEHEGYGPVMTQDMDGNIIITGRTASANYPTTPGCWDNTYSGGDELVISILGPRLDTLIASTYCQPSTLSFGPRSVAASDSGDIVVAGTVVSPHQTDAFVLTANSTLAAITSLVVFGGAEDDAAATLDIDGSGRAVLAGTTKSFDFPTSAGAHGTSFNGDPGDDQNPEDVFVCSVSREGFTTLTTGLECGPRTIFLPHSAWMFGEVSNLTYGPREIDARLSARLPDGTVVENLGYAHLPLDAGETFMKTWVKHFPYSEQLDGIVTFRLHAIDVTPPPWNQPPYPPSGQMDTSELPIRIIVP